MLSKEELEHRAKWPDGTFDKEAATELLSLREQLAEKEERLCRLRTSLEIEMKGHEAAERQLAELKALPPSFYVLKTAYADAWGDACDLRCYEDETDVSKAKDDFGGVIIPLFTAAKPAEE